MKKIFLSLLLLPIGFTAFAEDMPIHNRMSGSMDYVEIEFPRDEGDHYRDPRYMEPEKYKQWYEWWYFNGKLQTTNNRNFGYMVVVFHYTFKDEKTNKYQELMDGNMLISDLDNEKSYFSAWPLWLIDPDNPNLSVPYFSSFSKEKLDIEVMGYPKESKAYEDFMKRVAAGESIGGALDETAIDHFYKFHSYSSKSDTNQIDMYEIKTKGRAIIEPGKISKKYFDNMREVYLNKVFEKIRGKYSNMGLDLTLKRDMKPLIINTHGILDMAEGGDSYYYTFPHLKTGGTITIGDNTFEIASGDSWMDHQWGDFDVKEFGWEWFSIRLENGTYANIFIQVDKNKAEVSKVANFVLPGEAEPIVMKKDDFSVTARKAHWTYNAEDLSDYSGINVGYDGVTYPQEFVLDFPSIGLTATITSEFKHQFGFFYWEGFSKVEATWNGKKLSGFSFTELIYPQKKG